MKNLKEAVRWYTLAAEKGHAAAQNSLGVCYFLGEGVEKNLTQAKKWLTLAAEQGNEFAHHNLGEFHLVTDQDYPRAAQHFLSGPFPISPAFLGFMTEKGFGVERDMEAAMTLHAESPCAFSELRLGITCLLQSPSDFKSAEQHFQAAKSEGDIDFDYSYASFVKWSETLAQGDDKDTSLMLAFIFQHGLLGITPDETKAMEYLRELNFLETC